ncbi:MAG: SPOR domain-containing protein [Deltaproteobacteria bacterium]|nr:SPOR domain-containing protein [Deltaproteobacteria bacterium]
MRYTASAAMEDRTLRDVERWKDKIEIRLDNRQVFFLFFGSALVACLLFVLGVVVGKRLESRGRAAAPEIEDPLALLDRIAATPGNADETITFPRTLIQAPTPKPEKKLAKAEAKPIPEAPAPKAEAAPEPAVAPKAAEKPKVIEPAPEPAKVAVAPTAVKADEAAAVKADAKKPGTKPELSKAEKAKLAAAPAKFSLQLGSFQSKEEADAFMSQFPDAAPYMVTSDIPGKGRWFRVRVGKFATSEDAAKAKGEFERQHQKIAYIAPL